jgi:eukaryotic-like serine/threonine-protein kinase
MDNSVEDPLGIVGSTVDKYRILALAGEGGFSVVYQAEHPVWRQPVAIKFFTILEHAEPELREHLLEDFVQEGKLMSSLSGRSAAIVQARDIGKLERPGGSWIPYMVLEWLDGRSLEQVLHDERCAGLPPRTALEAVRLLQPAAHALTVAHKHNVAHRDLKPANLVVLGDAREPGALIKVLDFGIAKIMGEHDALNEQLQRTGQRLTAFTPSYGAPEQFSRSHGATGPWTDVHAMALILLEVMRGGDAVLRGESLYDVGQMSCDPEHRPTPRALGLEVSDEVEAVVGKALALRAEDRYPSMSELWAALERAVGIASTVPSSPGVQPVSRTQPGLAPPLDGGGESVPFQSTVKANAPTVAAVATSVPPVRRAGRRMPLLLGGGLGLGLLAAWLVMHAAAVDAVGSNASASGSLASPTAAQTDGAGGSALVTSRSAQTAAASPPSASSGSSEATSPDGGAGATAAVATRGAPGARPAGRAPGAGTGGPAAGPAPAPTGNPWDPKSFGGRQ